MQEQSLKDRLQPALLDRLVDDERLLTLFRIRPDADRMKALGVTVDSVERVLAASGFRRVRDAPAAAASDSGGVLEYLAPRSSTSSPRALRVPVASGAQHVALAEFCEIHASTISNSQIESPDRRAISMKKLREAVLRDLGWLLNASGIDDVVDLESYPEVRRSVLNFGLRSQAGRAISSLDPAEVARRIRDAIAWFEPRLSEVRVIPEIEKGAPEGMVLSFLVEAELWGQPVAQQLSMRTSIDIDSGDVAVVDRAARS